MNRASGSRCLNCSAELHGPWCSECGQKGDRRLRGARALLVDVVQSLGDVDRGLVPTLRRLVLEPGALVRKYADGHFIGQTSPMRLYLGVSALYFFLGPYLGGGMVRFGPNGTGGPGTGAGWFSFGPMTWDSELLLLLLIPLWALVARVVVAGPGRHIEEVFVFSVHYQVFFLLLISVAGLLASLLIQLGLNAAVPVLLLGVLVVPLTYLHRALGTAFGFGGLRRTLTTPVLFILHLAGGQALQNLI